MESSYERKAIESKNELPKDATKERVQNFCVEITNVNGNTRLSDADFVLADRHLLGLADRHLLVRLLQLPLNLVLAVS